MNLTEKETLEETIKMWIWLSEHLDADKGNYFTAMEINDEPNSNCHCCENHIKR